MANTITKQTLLDGSRYLIVKIDILADTAAEYTDEVLIDASTYSPAFTNESLQVLHANLVGFSARLLWDATANVVITSIPDYEVTLIDHEMGGMSGIPNNAGAGKTGDILLTTSGLGVGDHGTIILRIKKKS